jgi:hypothetical protein
MAITLTELKEWSNDLYPILVDINVSAKNSNILHHENSKNFKEKHTDLFWELFHQQLFIVIVQLDKIFSNSCQQRRNFKKLCNRYQNEVFDYDIEKKLSNNSRIGRHVFQSRSDVLKAVDEIISKLDSIAIVISKINTLRDKVYAHTDPNSISPLLNLDEIFSLVILANEIFNSLLGKTLDEFTPFEMTQQLDIRVIIDAFK